MSATILSWLALAVTLAAFAVLWYLKRSGKAGFGLRVLVATAVGIAIGVVFQNYVDYVAFFGDVWSQVILALVVPLLFFSVIASITGLADSIKLRNITAKSVVLLLLNTFTSSLITLALAGALHVGRGFDYELPTDYEQSEVPGVVETLVGLFPSNVAENWTSNQVVPVVVFALLVAFAYNRVVATEAGRVKVESFRSFIDAGNTVLGRAVQIVVDFTPYAVLSLIAAAVGTKDVATLLPLLLVLVVAYVAMILQFFVVQPLILAATTRLNPLYFFKTFWPAAAIAFTSQSSIGTIPVTVRQLKQGGVPEETGSFIASLGANLGMPGCAGVWPTLLAVFAINALGLTYSPWQYAVLVGLTLLVSIGTVGVPGTATITATSVFAAAGLPVPFIAIAQPISSIVDMGRTALNVASAANTAVIVAATEGQLDQAAYRGEPSAAATDDSPVVHELEGALHVR